MDIQAAFEKAYWKLEPTLPDDKKDLATATLRWIAPNYIERKGPKPPKTLLKSINKLKKRDDIVITKPDKGSGVVVMDKSDYVRLLCEASINDPTKFTPVGLERPPTRGRPPKYYHPPGGGGGGVLPYMGYIGMCRCEGYGFQAVYSSIGYINQSVWV